MTRDQSVTTLRLAPDSHLVLIVDVDPARLDLAGRRLLAAVREAVGAWEANETARKVGEAGGPRIAVEAPESDAERLTGAPSTDGPDPRVGETVMRPSWEGPARASDGGRRPRGFGVARSARGPRRGAQGLTGGSA